MATTLFVPGPAEIAVGLGGGATFGGAGGMLYLGLTEGPAEVQQVLHSGNVNADYAGAHGMPADMLLDGVTMLVTCQMKKVDPVVLNLVRAHFLGGPLGGGILPGTLILAEQLAFTVMIRSQYVGIVPQFSAFNPGLRLRYAVASGQQRWSMGTNTQVNYISFLGLTLPNTLTVPMTYTCWDTNLGGFPPTT